jgi:hypothetical protein
MACYLRMMFRFAAMTGIAAMLSAAAPAVAADSTVTASEAAAATAKTAPSVAKNHAAIKRDAARRTRIAASHRDRYYPRVRPIRSDLDRSDVWYGRQFVLMIGVGY